MRNAIITGGGQGIGKAIAQRLLQDGYRVLIAEIDPQAGRETVDEFASLGDIHFQHTDVTCEADIIAVAKVAAERFGSVHALVNNVGIGRTKPLAELTLSDWRQVIDANLTSIFLAARHIGPLWAEKAAMVNIASTRALMSEPNTEAYAASKGGVVALTHALAVSLGPRVRVNCISPGWIDCGPWKKSANRKVNTWSDADHAQHPAGRVGTPEDIAAMAAHLLSDAAGFITGQNFVVDGGMTRKMIYV